MATGRSRRYDRDLEYQRREGPHGRQTGLVPANPPEMEGVVARQIANVLTKNGYLTEVWRPEWELDDLPVGQVFQRILERAPPPGGMCTRSPPTDYSEAMDGSWWRCTTQGGIRRPTGKRSTFVWGANVLQSCRPAGGLARREEPVLRSVTFSQRCGHCIRLRRSGPHPASRGHPADSLPALVP